MEVEVSLVLVFRIKTPFCDMNMYFCFLLLWSIFLFFFFCLLLFFLFVPINILLTSNLLISWQQDI